MTGVVQSRLLDREPAFWGWMTKYFDYAEAGDVTPPKGELGDRTLKTA